jgi:hypothetical protein
MWFVVRHNKPFFAGVVFGVVVVGLVVLGRTWWLGFSAREFERPRNVVIETSNSPTWPPAPRTRVSALRFVPGLPTTTATAVVNVKHQLSFLAIAALLCRTITSRSVRTFFFTLRKLIDLWVRNPALAFVLVAGTDTVPGAESDSPRWFYFFFRLFFWLCSGVGFIVPSHARPGMLPRPGAVVAPMLGFFPLPVRSSFDITDQVWNGCCN